MKYFSFFFCFSLLTLFSINIHAQAEDPAILATQSAIEQFFAKDINAYAAHFAEQGELVNPMGYLMTGPQEIIQAHQPYLKMIEGRSTLSEITKQSVRYLRPDVATVLMSVNTWSSKDGVSTEPRPNTVTATLSLYNGTWLIDQFQVTPVTPLPTQG